MQSIITYLFSCLPGIVTLIEFSTFMAAASLVAVASLIVWAVSNRR